MKISHTAIMKIDGKDLWDNKIIRLLGITVAVYLFVRFVLPLVIPFLMGFLIATFLYRLLQKFHGKNKRENKFGKVACMTVYFTTLFIVGAIILGICYGIVMQITDVCSHVPEWINGGEQCIDRCCLKIEQISGWNHFYVKDMFEENVRQLFGDGKTRIVACIWNGSICGVRGFLRAGWIFIVISIATLLTLFDYSDIVEELKKRKEWKRLKEMLNHTKHAGGIYLKAQAIILLIVMIICTLGLVLTGNRYALVAGIGIGICDALPFLGTGTVFIPWMIVELVRGAYAKAIIYFGIYICCSLVRELLEPRLIGDSIGVRPLFVLISIYIGMRIYGAAGVVLGPLSAFLIWELYRDKGENEKISVRDKKDE